MMDSSSQGASAGAFQPAVAEAFSKPTWAPYGGLRSNVSLTAPAATAASVVGASRSDSLNTSSGSSTLPADPTAGRPSAPVTATVARQVLLISSSTGSLDRGCTPLANGSFPATVEPRTFAAAEICARRSLGIAA